jgi:uncharacterized protein YuzE
MRLRHEGNRAHLALDESAAVAHRQVFTDEDDREAWGITMDFDSEGRLVGMEFEDPERQLPSSALGGAPELRVEYDATAGAAYLYLTHIRRGGVEHTLAFGEDDTRAAWGINLDFDRKDRLVGIEFESDALAPKVLLDGAPAPRAPSRWRRLLWRFGLG